MNFLKKKSEYHSRRKPGVSNDLGAAAAAAKETRVERLNIWTDGLMD